MLEILAVRPSRNLLINVSLNDEQATAKNLFIVAGLAGLDRRDVRELSSIYLVNKPPEE